MAKWYETLQYGIYEGVIINRAEYLTLRKHGVEFIVVVGE